MKRPRKERHLTLVTTPPPTARTITVTADCCTPTVVLGDDGTVIAVHHEGDHHPDLTGIAVALLQGESNA